MFAARFVARACVVALLGLSAIGCQRSAPAVDGEIAKQPVKDFVPRKEAAKRPRLDDEIAQKPMKDFVRSWPPPAFPKSTELPPGAAARLGHLESEIAVLAFSSDGRRLATGHSSPSGYSAPIKI